MRTNAPKPGRALARPLPWTGRLGAFLAVIVLAFGLAGCSLLQPADGEDGATRIADDTPATREEVAEIQKLLAARGYNPGPADGLMGPRTAAAIREYQQEADLEPTGAATRGLLARLQDTASGPGRRPPKPARPVAIETARPGIGTPTYSVGDTYVFSHGIAYTVLRVGADRVTWRDSRGDSFTTPLVVAMPQIEWQNGAWKGRNEIRRDEGAGWPPARGTEAIFDVRSEEWNVDAGPGADRAVTDARWSCHNDGSDKIVVPAGEFDAAVISCERSPAPAGLWQRRVWNYAPEVAHFIQRTDSDGSGIEIESIQLVAAIPGTENWPPAARAGLKMAMNAALSESAVGEEKAWRSTAVREEFAVRVTSETTTAAGRLCRTYVIVRTSGSGRQVYPAVACRSRDGKNWQTPGFDGGVVGLGPASAGNG